MNLVYTNTNSSTVPGHIYVLTTDTADHEQVWQPYAVDPYYSAISKWWPYLLALYIIQIISNISTCLLYQQQKV